MKKLVSIVVIMSMAMSSIPAFAAPSATSSATQLAPPVVVPLAKDKPAPFAGVLLSPEAVASVIAQKDAASDALTLAVKHQSDLDAAELKFQIDQLTTTCTADKGILQAQVDDGSQQVKVLTGQLRDSSSGPGAPVWVGVGAAGGVIVTVLATLAIIQATK